MTAHDRIKELIEEVDRLGICPATDARIEQVLCNDEAFRALIEGALNDKVSDRAEVSGCFGGQ